MLETPIGKIKISVNDEEIDYIVEKYTYDMTLLRENPVDACYRISVKYKQKDTVKCEILLNTEVEDFDSCGEFYCCKIFQKDKTQLTLGTYNEISDNCELCDYLDNGLIFRDLEIGQLEEIVFGVAWVTDLKDEDDYRTWTMADPSLDNKILGF